jgi:8-oxo-dGTP pyrophosphatase MutT (NUDIX family)
MNVSAGLIITDGNYVLVEQPIGKSKGEGKYDLPKGHVEKDESFIDAAFREAYEETGYDFSNYKYYARPLSSVPMPYNSAKKIILYEVRVDNLPDLSSYKCKSFFKNSAGKLVPEVIGYAYKPITELSIWLFPNYKKIIDKIKL